MHNAGCRKEGISFLSRGDRMEGSLFTPLGDVPGPCLIVCHGALDFKENYYPLCEFLVDRGIAALAIDMHGHGSSGGKRLHVDMEEWVSDILAAIAFLKTRPEIKPSSIGAFGISSGGTAVLEASLRSPEIRVLITLDATVRDISTPMEYLLIKIGSALGRIKSFFTGDGLRLSLQKELKKVQAASDPEVNRRWIENPKVIGMWSAFPLPGAAQSLIVDTIRRVPGIKAPTLVIHGEEDRVDPPESAHILFNALTCMKDLCIVPGNGHLGHLDRNRERVMELTADWASTHLV